MWLAEGYPLSLSDQLLPIVELMALNNAHFDKLKDFLTLQVPAGFPVKIGMDVCVCACDNCVSLFICVHVVCVSVLTLMCLAVVLCCLCVHVCLGMYMVCFCSCLYLHGMYGIVHKKFCDMLTNLCAHLYYKLYS